MTNMNRFFTEAFEKHPDRENLYKALFMMDESEYGAQMRVAYYREKLKHMGENVKIGVGVRIVNPQYISLGDNVRLYDGATLIARGEGGIELADKVRIKENAVLDTERMDGYIKIGKGVYIGTGTTLFGHCGLEIGDESLLAQNITITPYSHIFDDSNVPIKKQGGHERKVTIGKDCYLGMNVSVLYSADIGDGSVVGAGAVVVKTLPPMSVAVGNPARVIRKRDILM